MNFINFFRQERRSSDRVFLDYAGGTPMDNEVIKEMEKYHSLFANPSGIYSESISARETLQAFRARVAKVLNVNKNEIVFTSGGTEGNNLALLGAFEFFNTKDFTPHVITTAIEHSSILEVVKEIERRGGEVTVLPVQSDGLLSPMDLKNALKENTILVSIGFANSEIGTVQPISEIAKIIKNSGSKAYLHVDAGSAPLYLSLDTARHGVALLTIDGSKIYGPKGVGILYVKSGTNLRPIMFGGGQERGLRAGTENLVGISGFTLALEIANQNRESESARLTEIRDGAIGKILENFPDAKLNGSHKHRLPNNINICFPGLDAEFATVSLDVLGFAVSYSSSCMTLKEDFSSYVIRAITREGNPDCSKSSLRVTLGNKTKQEDIDKFIIALKSVVLK